MKEKIILNGEKIILNGSFAVFFWSNPPVIKKFNRKKSIKKILKHAQL